MNFKYLAAFLFLILAAACDKKTSREDEAASKKPQSDLIIPKDKTFRLGETIKVETQSSDPGNSIDSVLFYANNKLMAVIKTAPFSLEFDTESLPVGQLSLRSAVYFKGGGRDIDHATVTLLSDIVPVDYGYRIIHSYKHDSKAFTQGLIYHNGNIYEGTGQNGASSIRKIELETGRVLQARYIPNDYFGEGITIIGDKLYQLTWRSRKGFVYNLDDFELIREFSYRTEGWGLTNMGDTLVMSDGTHSLHLLDTKNFAELGKIDVYDQNGPVIELNELEYINGHIYANIYQTDKIAIIDPKNGKVTAYIDLAGLVDKNIQHGEIDVLNGIAYNPSGGRLYVTGKNWTHLFEIQLIKKEPLAVASQD